MYIINDYQLIQTASELYLSNYHKGVKIPSSALAAILHALKQQEKLEISEEQLTWLAEMHHIDFSSLKKVLMNQLNILKPMQSKKLPKLYINSDDALISELLLSTLAIEYACEVVAESTYDVQGPAMFIFYRKNYSSAAFNTLYQQLQKDVYLITAGMVHKLLIIDNLYLKESGLPSHFSNLHQLTAYLNSDIPTTKNNWLLFYREIFNRQLDAFPEPIVNACQRGYIAYALHQFVSQFTNLWGAPMLLDKVNWFWHVDLCSFSVHQEIAIHSPYAEQDMRISIMQEKKEELV